MNPELAVGIASTSLIICLAIVAWGLLHRERTAADDLATDLMHTIGRLHTQVVSLEDDRDRWKALAARGHSVAATLRLDLEQANARLQDLGDPQ